jgi:hypothetical protein
MSASGLSGRRVEASRAGIRTVKLTVSARHDRCGSSSGRASLSSITGMPSRTGKASRSAGQTSSRAPRRRVASSAGPCRAGRPAVRSGGGPGSWGGRAGAGWRAGGVRQIRSSSASSSTGAGAARSLVARPRPAPGRSWRQRAASLTASFSVTITSRFRPARAVRVAVVVGQRQALDGGPAASQHLEEALRLRQAGGGQHRAAQQCRSAPGATGARPAATSRPAAPRRPGERAGHRPGSGVLGRGGVVEHHWRRAVEGRQGSRSGPAGSSQAVAGAAFVEHQQLHVALQRWCCRPSSPPGCRPSGWRRAAGPGGGRAVGPPTGAPVRRWISSGSSPTRARLSASDLTPQPCRPWPARDHAGRPARRAAGPATSGQGGGCLAGAACHQVAHHQHRHRQALRACQPGPVPMPAAQPDQAAVQPRHRPQQPWPGRAGLHCARAVRPGKRRGAVAAGRPLSARRRRLADWVAKVSGPGRRAGPRPAR